MKKSQNINYSTPLQSNAFYSKKSNAQTCSTIASDKQSSDFENYKQKTIVPSITQKEKIMIEIEQILMRLNNPQIPYMYFRDIHTHIKNNEFKFSTSINATFKDCYIKSKKSQLSLTYLACRKKAVGYMSDVNLILQHFNSFYMSTYLFDKLNQISFNLTDSKVIDQEQFNTNFIVALNLTGKLCEIYPYRLNDIMQLTQIHIPIQKIEKRQGQILLQIGWKLIQISQYDYFGLYSVLCNVSESEYICSRQLIAQGLTSNQLMQIDPITKAIAVIIALKQMSSKSCITQFFEKLITLNSISRQQLNKAVLQYNVILKQYQFNK